MGKGNKSKARSMGFPEMKDTQKIYYSSHGCFAKWSEIRKIEVDERGNNTNEEVDGWEEKYGLKDDDRVLWVAKDKRMAASYGCDSGDIEYVLSASEEDFLKYCEDNECDSEPEEINIKDGFLIEESDDGDDGVIFVLRNYESEEGIKWKPIDMLQNTAKTTTLGEINENRT